MDKRTKRGKNAGKLEVCYSDENGTSQRVVCKELDRTSIKLGEKGPIIESLSDALKGYIVTRGAFREVQFQPMDLHWVRIITD